MNTTSLLKQQKKFTVKVFVSVIVAWIGFGCTLHFFKEGSFVEFNKLGEFGDSFGMANSLFSSLALAGIIISLFFQREDLKLTIEEQKGAREAQEEAVNVAKIKLKNSHIQRKMDFLKTQLEVGIANATTTISSSSALNKAKEERRQALARYNKEMTILLVEAGQNLDFLEANKLIK